MPVTPNTLRKAYVFESERPYVVPILEFFAARPDEWISLTEVREHAVPEIDQYEWVRFARMFIERKDGCGLGFLDKSADPKDPHGRKFYRVVPEMIPEMQKFISVCRSGND